MHISKILHSLVTSSTQNLSISVSKTGIVYDNYPSLPYQTDMFLIRDKKNEIQYEIYAININGVYEIVEITKIEKDKVVSSIDKDEVYKTLVKEVEVLLGKVYTVSRRSFPYK